MQKENYCVIMRYVIIQSAVILTPFSEIMKENMKIEVKANGIWYHGAKVLFSEPRTNSTITQWKELAEAFSHQPSALGYNNDGVISHNGVEKVGYRIGEPEDGYDFKYWE